MGFLLIVSGWYLMLGEGKFIIPMICIIGGCSYQGS